MVLIRRINPTFNGECFLMDKRLFLAILALTLAMTAKGYIVKFKMGKYAPQRSQRTQRIKWLKH